jgi:hypothetical protein
MMSFELFDALDGLHYRTAILALDEDGNTYSVVLVEPDTDGDGNSIAYLKLEALS